MLVDSALLPSNAKAPSAEDLARRERQRTAALSGIVEYAFSPSGEALLFPIAGDLFYCRIITPIGPAIDAIPVAGPVTDATIGPGSTLIAYVRTKICTSTTWKAGANSV